MQIGDVLWFLQLAARHHITIWIDGGWGIDALLKQQTRPHDDLDIVVETHHLERLTRRLTDLGFQRVRTHDERDWNFVMADEAGRRIDFHVITLAADGRGIYGPIENGDTYPAEALTGTGQIGSVTVRCTSARFQLTSHDAGYALRPKDHQDIKALCEAFGFPLPQRFL